MNPSGSSGDDVDLMPVDNNPPNQTETGILESLKSNDSKIKMTMSSLKVPLFAAALFLVISMPFIERLLCSAIKQCEDMPYLLLASKAILFMLVFFIVLNWTLFLK